MAAQMEKPRDVVGGLLIAAIGAGFLLVGGDLPVGTSRRMGAGYFPSMLSWLLIALDAIIAGVALLRGAAVSGSVGRLPWLGIVLIIGAVVFFGETLRGIGLAPALLVVVLATAWASTYASLRASIPLAIGLAAFCLLLFIRGLGLPLPVIGPWLTFGGPAPVAGSTPGSLLPARAASRVNDRKSAGRGGAPKSWKDTGGTRSRLVRRSGVLLASSSGRGAGEHGQGVEPPAAPGVGPAPTAAGPACGAKPRCAGGFAGMPSHRSRPRKPLVSPDAARLDSAHVADLHMSPIRPIG